MGWKASRWAYSNSLATAGAMPGSRDGRAETRVQPLGPPAGGGALRRVRGGDAARQAGLLRHLFRQSRFADLPRTGDGLQEPARQQGGLRPGER